MTAMRLLPALLVIHPALIAGTLLQNLQVEYRRTPIGIDVAKPRFSWQMAATAGERGFAQTAYRIEVKDAFRDTLVWDSQRVANPASLGITYAGQPLTAATRYRWTVTAWTNGGMPLTATSWFETGLMDSSPNAPAWGGAKWIGGSDNDLVLYAPYQSIFDLSYGVAIAPGSTRASFVYGANDSRLMDRYKNISQLQNGKDQSYIRLELDITGVEGGGKANLHVYRVGYARSDSADKPFRIFEIAPDIINTSNKNAEHVVEVRSAFGLIAITIDGKPGLTAVGVPAQPPGGGGGFRGRPAPNSVNLNPMGQGGDYLAFGLLCDIGYSMAPGQVAQFRNITVKNNRAPNNVLFRDGGQKVDGGSKGVFLVRDPSRNSSPMLRTAFRTAPGKNIDRARLYVTARGIYEFYLNGRRVSDDYYNPGLTQYNVTHMYQTYDVTSLLRTGENAAGAMLGEGWWSGLLSFGTIWNHFGDRQSLLAKLVITYKDGTADTIVSGDNNWKYFGKGPVVYSSLDNGEVYDASREAAVEGWSSPGYKDREWKAASIVPLEGTTFSGVEPGRFGAPGTPFQWDRMRFVGQIGDNAGAFRTLQARSVKEVRPGVFVYDLGQNIVGVPRISIANGRPGARLTLRFSEMLYPNLKDSGENAGMIMTENYRAALSQDIYTMKAGRQVFQPRFTSHGFQYVELTGIDKPLPLEAVQGVAVSSVRELSADYKSSNDRVNKLWSNLVWSNVDNFLSIPTDCPQRNERMGWSGDINVFSATATYVSNADQFLERHMQAMRDVQSPSGRFTDIAPVGGGFGGVLWGSAGIVVPWEAYQQYGDKGMLERHYTAMSAYVAHLEKSVDPKTGLSSDAQLGDWLGPQNNALGAAFLAAAYHAYDLGIMAKVAAVLGRNQDADTFATMYEKRKALFNSKFVNAEKKTIGMAGGGMFGGGGRPAEWKVADTQTSYAVGLGMKLFDDSNQTQMVRNLAATVERENKDDGGVMRPAHSLMTGFIGTAWISKALSENGLQGDAYKLLQNRQYPSWLYAIDQGATTIWERLNGYTVENGFGGNNSMNSFNHYSFGAVGQWLMAHSLGIQRDEPGFRKFVLQPEPDPTGGMTFAEGHYDSMYGRIHSAWKVDGNTLIYRATVPANSVATLYLPATAASPVTEGGKAVRPLRRDGSRSVFELASGTYEFRSTWR